MTIRPREHVLETESRKAFEQVVPSEWVVRHENPDYGLDIKVDVFKHGHLTPLFFYVQVKGTDTLASDVEIPSYSFSTDRLLYYANCHFPVMLVLYDAKMGRLFYEWVHDLYNRFSSEEKRKLRLQKTLKVQLNRAFVRGDEIVIEKEVRNQFIRLGIHSETTEAFTIAINLNLSKDQETQVKESLVQWLQSDLSSRFIRLEDDKHTDGVITVNIDPLSTTPPLISMSCGQENITLPVNIGVDIDINELHIDLIIAITWVLSASGRPNSALDLIGRLIYEEHQLPVFSQAVLSHPSLANMYADTKRYAEALNIAEKLLRRGYSLPSMTIASTARISDSNPKYYSQEYRRFLKAVIESPNAKVAKGSLYYNLANSLRTDGLFREAIIHYHMAAVNEPSYRERSYWWAELGGCFFLVNKLTWAERCYRKAIELGETRIPAKPLLGDVLLHKGKFQEAKDIFEEYLKETNPPYAEFVLKYWLTDYLVSKLGDSRPDPLRALQLTEEAISAKELDESYQLLTEALNADPLCGFAWFNYAVCLGKKGQTDRTWEWLATAVIQNWDIEAWANTILSMLLGSTIQEMNLVTAAAMSESFRLHDLLLQAELEKIFNSQPNSTLDASKKSAASIATLANNLMAYFAQEIPPLSRFIGLYPNNEAANTSAEMQTDQE